MESCLCKVRGYYCDFGLAYHKTLQYYSGVLGVTLSLRGNSIPTEGSGRIVITDINPDGLRLFSHLQATGWLMSDTNSFSATRARKKCVAILLKQLRSRDMALKTSEKVSLQPIRILPYLSAF